MTDQRNFPEERKALDQLPESLLKEWAKKDDYVPMKRAADEILFSRFWLEKMLEDVMRGDQLVAKAAQGYQRMATLMTEVHQRLEEMVNSYDEITGGGAYVQPDEVKELISKIERAMRPITHPDEG